MSRTPSIFASFALAALAGCIASCNNSVAPTGDGANSSGNANAETSAIKVAAPTFSPIGGIYTSSQAVAIKSATGGAVVYYTTDGSVPTSSSTPYTDSITVDSSQTLKAIAVKSGMMTSSVDSATYTIQTDGTPSNMVTWGGQSYRTVTIGTQTWMAENLNYSGSSGGIGVCYANTIADCDLFGRLYTWAEVMNGASSSTASPSGVQGICPTGWHVPSTAEWNTLATGIGGVSNAGSKLKSKSGWSASGNGTDDYGFTVLPVGYRGANGAFTGIGDVAEFWSATMYDGTDAWYRRFSYSEARVYVGSYPKTSGLPLRCTKD